MSNLNKNEFRPQLSKHELILNKYKLILQEGSNTANQNYSHENTMIPVKNSSSGIYNKLIAEKLASSVIEKSKEFIYNENKVYNITNDTKFDDANRNIEAIKLKYINKNNFVENKLTSVNSLITNIESVNKNCKSNLISLCNYHSPEIEMIKKKYSNLVGEIKVQNNIFEDKILKYKKENFSNCKLEDIKNGDENGQSNCIKDQNNLILEKINSVEHNLSKIKDFSVVDKNIVENVKQTNNSNLNINKYNSKLKQPKNKSHTQLKNIHNETIETRRVNDLLNTIMNDVVSRILEKDYNSVENTESFSNNDEIILIPKTKTKIFKLRSSSMPKKKITTFEEFLNKN